MIQFLWGALSASASIVALLFLRFWRDTRDRIFLFFSAAFLMLCLNWSALVFIEPRLETRHYVYLLRLLAFMLIIAGVVDKNRRSASTRGE
jgi:hypothetical protein